MQCKLVQNYRKVRFNDSLKLSARVHAVVSIGQLIPLYQVCFKSASYSYSYRNFLH